MTAGFNTRAVHAGRADLTDLGVHALPIDLSTTNPLPDIDAGGASYEQLATGGDVPEGGSAVYARLWNPTVARFETALAKDRKSTRLNSRHVAISYAVFCWKKKRDDHSTGQHD